MGVVLAAVGWAGAFGLVAGYALVSAGRLGPEGSVFQMVNVAGGAALALNSGVNGAWPSAVLNVVWVAIGLYTLTRLVTPRPAEAGQARTARSSRSSSTRKQACSAPSTSTTGSFSA